MLTQEGSSDEKLPTFRCEQSKKHEKRFVNHVCVSLISISFAPIIFSHSHKNYLHQCNNSFCKTNTLYFNTCCLRKVANNPMTMLSHTTNGSSNLKTKTTPTKILDTDKETDEESSTSSTDYSNSSEELRCVPCKFSLHHVAPSDKEEDCMKECLVCWEDLKANDGPHDTLPCGHVFHRSCVNDWRYQNQSCPTCRTNLEFAEMHC